MYGARPLKRFMQSHAETLLAKYILKNNPAAGTRLLLDANGDGLFLTET